MDPLAIEIPPDRWSEITRHLAACMPEEGCGLVGGRGGKVEQVIPVDNAAHSPVRFRMEPSGQVEAMSALEASGQDLVAIYHSHPSGPSGPSPTDLAEAAYPEAVYLILSPVEAGWRARAFRIREGIAAEVRVIAPP